MRTILVHVNVELADDDPRSADEIAMDVIDAVRAGDPDYDASVPLVEEV